MYSSARKNLIISNYSHAVTPRECYTGRPEKEGQEWAAGRDEMKEFNSQYSARC